MEIPLPETHGLTKRLDRSFTVMLDMTRTQITGYVLTAIGVWFAVDTYPTKMGLLCMTMCRTRKT